MTEGEEAREAGMERVIANTSEAWQTRYFRLCADFFRDLPIGAIFTGEQLRANATEKGLPEPHHVNAWSANTASYTRALCQCGMAEAIGTANARTRQSHAHRLWQYRRLK